MSDVEESPEVVLTKDDINALLVNRVWIELLKDINTRLERDQGILMSSEDMQQILRAQGSSQVEAFIINYTNQILQEIEDRLTTSQERDSNVNIT